MSTYPSSIAAHYGKTWGQPSAVHQFKKGPMYAYCPGFSILEFAPCAGRAYQIYATAGMATIGRSLIELHLFSSVQDESLVELLTAIAYYNVETEHIGAAHAAGKGCKLKTSEKFFIRVYAEFAKELKKPAKPATDKKITTNAPSASIKLVWLQGRIIDLLRRETTRPEIDLFRLVFGYFFVRSAATNSKIPKNQPKNL